MPAMRSTSAPTTPSPAEPAGDIDDRADGDGTNGRGGDLHGDPAVVARRGRARPRRRAPCRDRPDRSAADTGRLRDARVPLGLRATAATGRRYRTGRS